MLQSLKNLCLSNEDSSSVSIEHIRKYIYKILLKHEPSLIDQIDNLMYQNKGKENKLIKSLAKKYHIKYKRMKPIKFESNYTINQRIGIGAFSTVYQCTKKKTNQLFALKMINKKFMKKEELVLIYREITILRDIKHDNIVCLHDIFENNMKTYLILDLLLGGELFDRIIEKGYFCEKIASQILMQILLPLNYLHERNIIHRDIKPENFVFENEMDNCKLKLIDFGLAISCQNKLINTFCGSYIYCAPEVVSKNIIIHKLICGHAE